MKTIFKLFLLAALLSTFAPAQTTPNLHLNVPAPGTLNWGTLLNANFTSLDTYLACIGTASTPGTVTYFNGASWVCLAGNTSGNQCLQETAFGVPSWGTCGGGGGGGATFQVNGVNTISQTTINFVNAPAFNGLSLTMNNASAGVIQPFLSGILGVQGGGTGITTVPGADYTLISNSFNSWVAQQINGGVSCGDPAHAINYNTVTHQFGCQAITATATAGGSNGQLQWNNATALGGITQWTSNGTTTITGGNSAVLNLAAMAPTSGLSLPTAVGAAPIADSFIGFNSTLHYLVFGSNGTTVNVAGWAGDIAGGTAVVPTVTSTHLSSALPINQGGTGTVSTLTGLVRGSASAMTAAELSGDVNTSGSNAVTVTAVHGNTVPAGIAAHQSLIGTGANTIVFKTIPDCNGGTNAINYTQSSDSWSCLVIAALSNPMTTLGDIITGGAAGVPTRLAGPTVTGGIGYMLVSTPSGGVATAPVWTPPGVAYNPQVGTSYTIAQTDRATFVTHNNAAAVGVTLPQAGTTGFAFNFPYVTCDFGAGTATITPTTSSISYATGTSFVSAAANMALTTGQCALIYSDNTNYYAVKLQGGGGGGGGSVTSIATTAPITGGTITTTGTIACPTCGVTTSGLNQFASTTSAQLAGVLSDETGSGAAVFATSPTLVSPTLGSASATSITLTGINAGFAALQQGSDSCVAGQPLNSVCVEAPATIATAYHILLPAAGATGIPLYTFSGVTITETIAAAVPIAQGGTGTSSTLTGLVRGSASAMTAAELSGDATTSGSNAVSVIGVHFGTNAYTLGSTALVSGNCLGYNGTNILGVTCGSGGSGALSSITAATGANTIANGNNPQTWQWNQTTTTQTGMTFTESAASTNGVGSQYLVAVSTLAGSSSIPMLISNSLTGAETLASLKILPTWNTSGIVDAGILLNVTNTASGSGSMLADFQIGGVSLYKWDKLGNFTIAGASAGYIGLGQGTSNSTGTTNIILQAPTSVTSYVATLPGTHPANNNSAMVFSNAAPAVGSYAKMQQLAVAGASYTNATTTFSNVSGLSFAVEATTTYGMSCHLYFQSSATTAGIKAQITGPASPNSVFIGLHQPLTASTYNDAVASAFSSSLGVTTTTTATTNFEALLTMGLSNGANAGTVQVQLAAEGAGTLTLQNGSFCELQ